MVEKVRVQWPYILPAVVRAPISLQLPLLYHADLVIYLVVVTDAQLGDLQRSYHTKSLKLSKMCPRIALCRLHKGTPCSTQSRVLLCIQRRLKILLSQVLAFLPRPLDAVFKTMDTGQSISKANSDRRAKKHKTASVVDMSALVL